MPKVRGKGKRFKGCAAEGVDGSRRGGWGKEGGEKWKKEGFKTEEI